MKGMNHKYCSLFIPSLCGLDDVIEAGCTTCTYMYIPTFPMPVFVAFKNKPSSFLLGHIRLKVTTNLRVKAEFPVSVYQ